MVSVISSRWSQVPVTALAWVDDRKVLVGEGQFVMIIDSGVVVARRQVLRAATVHSLERVEEGRWVVRGGKSVAVLRLSQEEDSLEMEMEETQLEDWIIASAVEEKTLRLMLLTAHNKLVCWRLERPGCDREEREPDSGPCILYSGLVLPSKRLVMSGTVFGRLLIWCADTGQLLHSVAGHDGVIFNVVYSGGFLATSSDDRSSILYRCSERFTEVEQVARMWGHTARVFRLAVCEERDVLVTAGEDGRLITWSLATGEQLETIQTSSPVWSLAVRGSSVLAGGGDGSVTTLRLIDSERSAVRLDCGVSSPRIVRSLSSDRVLVVGGGHLVSYDLTSQQSTVLYSNTELSSYCLLEVEADRLLLAGLEGLLVSGDLSENSLINLQTRRVMEGKIFSCGLFSIGGEETVLICDGMGRLTVLDWRLETRGEGELPVMKERWFTSHCTWRSYYVLGDRSGGLHLLQLTGSSLTLSQSWPRLHGRQGVTQVLVDRDILWTSGRDGTVRTFREREGRVEMLQSVRVGSDWVGGVVRVGRVLAGLLWRGSELQLRSLEGDSLLGSAECGGGHRSWALLPGQDSLSVVFIKDGAVMVSPLTLGHTSVLRQGQHTQQVNVVRTVGDLVITGSEDTTVRVFREGRQVAVMRGHLSSVKCMETVKGPGDSLLLLTGGGRGELRLWRLVRVGEDVFCRSEASHLVREEGKGRRKAWKVAQSERQSEGEMRLMSVDSSQTDLTDLTVYAACSDGSLRQYSYRHSSQRLELERMGEEVRPHCLQQVKVMGESLVTTSTGGDIAVWSRAALRVRVETRAHQSGVNCLALKRESQDSWLVVTGGDDTSLVVTRYQEPDRLEVVWQSGRRGHTTQVTGLSLVGDLVMSAGVDQRLVVWRLTREGELDWQSSKVVSVADISDLDCYKEAGQVHCALVGVGMEMLTVQDFPAL